MMGVFHLTPSTSSDAPTSWCGASIRQVPSRARNCFRASISSRSGFLLRDHVIKTEHHESVRIREYSVVDRQFLSGLVDPLVDSDRLPGNLSDDRLEAHCRQMKQLKRPGNSLQKHLLRIFRLLVIRPCYTTHLGYG